MLFATETQGHPMDLFYKISVLQADQFASWEMWNK